ncbi:TIGR02281 family clan AA aspartic protease [Aquicoccus sp. G2-2]|uniref:retropepsin-like aspartic protease family protein n=1 Tax=Aquicoccus sp. G2-2 TaxID=3092120 RepID=UPI002AE047F2|nr:TIGR02281 family clan AA aspartic protease [Aquicoccus sp. G2-2]MEA1112858.1 TIGR02281 family clan AA aspartic protease [Aquicoccus sp. G2-2]
MSNDYASLTYLVVLLCALVAMYFTRARGSFGKLAQQALAWGLIFAGAVAVIGLWGDIRNTVMPKQSVFAEEGRIVLPRARDGHYYLTADVNGAPVHFTVDTGASAIVLSREDAQAAGIDTDALPYMGRAQTANGEVRTAPVRIASLNIGGIHDSNVRALVNGGEMNGSLLGMSYLQRYSKIEITDGALTLTR